MAPELLTALLAAPGPSGHEEAPARIWRDAAASFAEVTHDTLGSSFARVRASEGATTLAVVGHIDEIGVVITHVEDNGLLSFTTIGGINPSIEFEWMEGIHDVPLQQPVEVAERIRRFVSSIRS